MIAKVSIFFHSAKCLCKKIEGMPRLGSPRFTCYWFALNGSRSAIKASSVALT